MRFCGGKKEEVTEERGKRGKSFMCNSTSNGTLAQMEEKWQGTKS